MKLQRTIKESFSIEGKALQSGLLMQIIFNPAPENYGYKIHIFINSENEIIMAKKSSTNSEDQSRSSIGQSIKEIRRQTQKVYTSDQKIFIVMEGMRAELSVAELCRKYGFSQPTHYKWNKEFIEAGKKRLSGDDTREATSGEVKGLRKKNSMLKESLADLLIRYDIVKKLGSIGLRPKWKRYMRLSAEEKSEIIRLVVNSSLDINKSSRSLGIHKRTFYNWHQAYSKEGIDGLQSLQ